MWTGIVLGVPSAYPCAKARKGWLESSLSSLFLSICLSFSLFPSLFLSPLRCLHSGVTEARSTRPLYTLLVLSGNYVMSSPLLVVACIAPDTMRIGIVRVFCCHFELYTFCGIFWVKIYYWRTLLFPKKRYFFFFTSDLQFIICHKHEHYTL